MKKQGKNPYLNKYLDLFCYRLLKHLKKGRHILAKVTTMLNILHNYE